MSTELQFAPYQEIEVRRALGGEPFRAHLLTRVGETFIIDRPKRESERGGWRFFDTVYVNNLLYLTYEYSGVRYEFKSSVLKVSYVPFYHLCLRLPDEREIRIRQIWGNPRYNGLVPIVLTARRKDGSEVLLSQRSYMVDIGRQGVGILSEDKVSRRFLLEMKVAADALLQMKCRVRNVKEERVNGFYYYGCEIEEVNDIPEFERYLEFLAVAADFFNQIPTDIGNRDEYSFFSFV